MEGLGLYREEAQVQEHVCQVGGGQGRMVEERKQLSLRFV